MYTEYILKDGHDASFAERSHSNAKDSREFRVWDARKLATKHNVHANTLTNNNAHVMRPTSFAVTYVNNMFFFI